MEPVTHLKLETPAGLISVVAEVSSGKVRKVTFRNVPAFATHLDASVEVLYSIAITLRGAQHPGAIEWIKFVLSSRGQEVLQQFGFSSIGDH